MQPQQDDMERMIQQSFFLYEGNMLGISEDKNNLDKLAGLEGKPHHRNGDPGLGVHSAAALNPKAGEVCVNEQQHTDSGGQPPKRCQIAVIKARQDERADVSDGNGKQLSGEIASGSRVGNRVE